MATQSLSVQATEGNTPAVPDASDNHRRIRESMEKALRIVGNLRFDAAIYLPQSGLMSQFPQLERIRKSADLTCKSLHEALEHLKETNALTLALEAGERGEPTDDAGGAINEFILVPHCGSVGGEA